MDGTSGKRRFILVSNTEATAEHPDKNLCRDVCAARVRKVIEGYGDTPGTGGDFAYLRCRRIPASRLVDIDHAQVWTALQLIHRETLATYSEAPFLCAGDGQELLIYVPRFRQKDVAALRAKVEGAAAAIVYSWQPGVLRQCLHADHAQHEPIPESLARRFGLGA